MKKMIIMIGAAIIACAAFAAEEAKSSAIAVDVDLGIYNKYVWRGILLDNNAVIQGSVNIAHESGFYANVWGNYSLSDEWVQGSQNDGLNEVDYAIGYGGTMDIVDYDIGVIHYNFPGGGNTFADTTEIYGGLALNNQLITPSVYVYYDLDENNGFYVVGDLNYGKDITEALSAEVGASQAWASANFADANYGQSRSMLADTQLYAGLGYAVSENVSLGASLAYIFAADGDVRRDTGDTHNNLVGGVNLTCSF